MFFTISKIIGFFLKAYNLIFFSILIYILLSKSSSRFLKGLSYFFGLFALLLVLVGSISFIPNYFNWKFENWIETQVPNGPDGIILLGGSFASSKKALDENQVGLNNNSERVIEALRLLNNYKRTKLLFVADASTGNYHKISEAHQARKFFEIFDISSERLIIKEIANNTYQESIAIAEYLRENGGKWIMITSALHMPRAITLMQSRDLGKSIIYPYLADFTSSQPRFSYYFSFDKIGNLDGIIHEMIGMVAYRITGRTKILFPDLNLIPVNFN